MESNSTTSSESELNSYAIQQAKKKEYREKNRELLREKTREYYKKNRSKILSKYHNNKIPLSDRIIIEENRNKYMTNNQTKKNNNKEDKYKKNKDYYERNREAIMARRKLTAENKAESNFGYNRDNYNSIFNYYRENYNPVIYNSLDEYLGPDKTSLVNSYKSDESNQHSLGGRRRKTKKNRKKI